MRKIWISFKPMSIDPYLVLLSYYMQENATERTALNWSKSTV